ncbi:hypothetical protein I352_04224 [Cryptococcus deuterogattii MMRL2647]|nr:hypothetical protein I352_04224 [Cryptococcus deuterogattii MMRL2647]
MLRKVSSSTAFHDRILEALFSQQKFATSSTLFPYEPSNSVTRRYHDKIDGIIRVHRLPAALDPSLRPKEWPDFMDMDDVKVVYESKGILGKIFRTRRKRVRDQNLNEPLREAYNILVNDVRETAQKIVNDFEFKTTLTLMQVVARHCYALTYGEVHVRQLGAGVGGRPLISFAWCFCQELIQIVVQAASTHLCQSASLIPSKDIKS